MQHFYENIKGWFDYQYIYTNMVRLSDDPGHFVEVGSYQGRSAAFMAVEIANSGKKISFDCVDIWTVHDIYDDNSINSFINNMEPAKGLYNAIQGDSTVVAPRYQDESLDFVWIDANHLYPFVIQDINAWLPKIKPNGYIGGHDYSKGVGGVGQAVRECFNENELMMPNNVLQNCWLYNKPSIK